MRSELRPTTTILIATFAAILFACSATATSTISLDAALDHSVVREGEGETAYLRVALTAPETSPRDRAAVNLSLVLDRSGSMSGQNLAEAKKAAIDVIRRLDASDIVSVVAYESGVQVLASAAPLGRRHDLAGRIRGLEAGGSTALFAGLAKAGYEVRKHLAPNRVDRIILLSDGLANVGPSSPGELAELGRTLGGEGIAVTTIGLGLGYNEQLMDRLAQASDGNHFFAERAEDLVAVFDRELSDVLSVVAQDVHLEIQLGPGVRLRRALGRPVHLSADQRAEAELLQLYSRQTKYVLLEVDLPPGRSGDLLEVAAVKTVYQDTSGQSSTLTQRVEAQYSGSQAAVEASGNRRVLGSVARQLGAAKNQLAMQLRDEGRIEQAKELLASNAAFLREQSLLLGNEWLAKDALQNRLDADALSEEDWQKQRKEMTQKQFEALRSLGYIE